MMEFNPIILVDIILGSMFIWHIVESMLISRRSHLMLKKHCDCKVTSFKILCNRAFGVERMSPVKMVTTTFLIFSLLLLAMHGTFFGLVGFIYIGTIGIAKICFSISTRFHPPIHS